MTSADLKMEMLINIATDPTNYFIGHLEDLDEQVAMFTSSGTTQLEVGPEFFAA